MDKYTLVRELVPQLEDVEKPKGLGSVELKFALNVFQGYSYRESYIKAIGKSRYSKMTPKQQSANLYKMKHKKAVREYLKALNDELEQVGVANSVQIQLFLTHAIFTPNGEVDKNHMLCQKHKVKYYAQDEEDIIEETCESVNKLQAAQMLIRMKGLDAPVKVDHNHTHQVGVMVVPMTSSVDEWEKLAANSQKQLMDDAVQID